MVSCSWEIRDGSVSCLSDLGGQSRIGRLKWDSWAKRQFMIWLTAAEPRQVKDRLSPGGKKLEAWQAHIEILSKVACCYRNQSSLIPAPQHWNTPDVGPTNKSNTNPGFLAWHLISWDIMDIIPSLLRWDWVYLGTQPPVDSGSTGHIFLKKLGAPAQKSLKSYLKCSM